MAPVEFIPIDGQGPGSPWVRSPQEIEDQVGILGALLYEMVSKGDREVDQLSYGERYAIGVRAAAQWTLGESEVSPLTAQTAAPSAGRVGSELDAASWLVANRGTGHEMAAGVRAWLAWMTGKTDRMVFMAL